MATARAALSPVRLLDARMAAMTREILVTAVTSNSRWLDVGCGLRPFAASFSHASYTGIDVEVSGRSGDLKRPDKIFDGVHIPYEDGAFDGILCTQVLEHVADVERLLAECNRVLRPNGLFVVSVPFVFREHEQPHDFRRFTSHGLNLLLARSGFSVTRSAKCLSAIETVATLLCVYVHNNLGSRGRFLNVLVGCLITAPALVLAELLSRILPDSRDLYCTLVTASLKDCNLPVES
jgi:SAM-dependent methyltransferase